jgi:plastocyanin
VLRLGGVVTVLFVLAASASAAHAQEPSVAATADNQFFPQHLTVPPNTTVYWDNRGTNHNVKFEDGLFEEPADPLPTPWRVWRHFDNPGVYRYYCEAHGGPGGQGMSGTITVAANAAPTLTGLKAKPRRICFRRTRRCRTTRGVVSFRLSEPARVFGALDRIGGSPDQSAAMEVDILGKAGLNSFRLSGRRLVRGVYRLTLAAEDPDGNESDPAVIRVRVK